METIKKTVLINAPVAEVFDYLDDPARLPDIWPSLIEVKNVKKQGTEGGHSFDWTYKMAGMHFHGHTENVEAKRNALRVFKNTGIPSTFRWTFTARGDRTEVNLETEYEIPVPLLGRLAEPFLRKINDREADTMLVNLKDHFEAGKELEEPIAPPLSGTGVRTEPPVMHH